MGENLDADGIGTRHMRTQSYLKRFAGEINTFVGQAAKDQQSGGINGPPKTLKCAINGQTPPHWYS
jgi:hypothetical protein